MCSYLVLWLRVPFARTNRLSTFLYTASVWAFGLRCVDLGDRAWPELKLFRSPLLLTVNLVFTLAMATASAQQIEVYAHDASGTPAAGYNDADRAFLVDAAMHGHRIAVKIGGDTNAQVFRGYIMQEYPRTNGADLCMMVTLFALNVNAAGDNFTARGAPYSANFCTNGEEYLRRGSSKWFNGLAMTWFVEEDAATQSIPILETATPVSSAHNATVLKGSKSELRDAVRSGEAIAIRTQVPGRAPAVYHGDHSQVRGDEACVMFQLFAINISSMSSFSALGDPWSANFCTDGREYLIDPSDRSDVIKNNLPFVWFSVP